MSEKEGSSLPPTVPLTAARQDSVRVDSAGAKRPESRNRPDSRGNEAIVVPRASFAAAPSKTENVRSTLVASDFGVTSEQGTRRTMEDEHKVVMAGDPVTPRVDDLGAINKNVPFFGVYDGHGGPHCAAFLKQHLHHLVLRHPSLRDDPELAVRDSIARAEHQFMEKCKAEKIESGSTCACALMLDDVLITANVGDSEIVLCRNDKPLLLTTKHSLGTASEMERVRAAGGRVVHTRVGHPKFNPQLVSLAVSRTIGDAGFKLEEYTGGKESGVIADADTKTTKLVPEDKFLIIGCDGLWDVVTYEEAVTFCLGEIEKGSNPQDVTNAIVQHALRKGSTDNVTVLFVLLSHAEASTVFSPTEPIPVVLEKTE